MNIMKMWYLALGLLFFSCRKDQACEQCNIETGYKDATIIYTGPLASDGCEWVVKVGADQYYHPENLKEEYKKNDLNVKICYEEKADKFHCGIAGLGMPVIRVIKIKK